MDRPLPVAIGFSQVIQAKKNRGTSGLGPCAVQCECEKSKSSPQATYTSTYALSRHWSGDRVSRGYTLPLRSRQGSPRNEQEEKTDIDYKWQLII